MDSGHRRPSLTSQRLPRNDKTRREPLRSGHRGSTPGLGDRNELMVGVGHEDAQRCPVLGWQKSAAWCRVTRYKASTHIG